MTPSFRAVLLVGSLLALLVALPAPAAAEADIAITGYVTEDGSFHPVSDGGTVPVGAQLRIRIWVDLYSCDPVTVDWGDGIEQSVNYGGAFALTWPHTYTEPGTYLIQATDACASSWDSATIHVGSGGLAILDPTSDLFLPSSLGILLGAAGFIQAFGGLRPGRGKGANGGPRLVPRTWAPGVPASMAAHQVSYRDIPLGAPRQAEPRIPVEPGEATDVLQEVHCPSCHGKLGYVAGGWFCLNARCPLIEPPSA